jgi:hypothetical protein
MGKKSTEAEVDRRILDVYQLLLTGHTYTDIKRYCSQTYNITSHRQVDVYIQRATVKIQEENSQTMEELRVDANARFNDLYKKLVKEGKHKDAAYVLQQKNKINGLEQIKVEHSGSVNILIGEAESGVF